MNARLRDIAIRVISQADRNQPADGVLRKELRSQKELLRSDSREISRWVFAYYRWFGWLDTKANVASRLAQAQELDADFQANPAQFSDADMQKAVPPWIAAHTEVTPAWLNSLQQHTRLWLRTRPGQAADMACRLPGATEGPLPDSLRYTGEEDLFQMAEFQAGDLQLQDISSQAVSHICAPRPKQLWWDTCAGEGGKMLHLATLMNSKGSVWATDRTEWRLQRLKLRARRSQVFNYRVAVWNGDANLPCDLHFDGVLVDAPCTAVGTWQRNPHARWTCTPEDVAELSAVQLKLLNSAIAALKPGGKLVYSVCTVTRSETVDVVAAFTQAHPEFTPLPFANPFEPTQPLAPTLQLWPQTCLGNGMFVAAWTKNPEPAPQPDPSSGL